MRPNTSGSTVGEGARPKAQKWNPKGAQRERTLNQNGALKAKPFWHGFEASSGGGSEVTLGGPRGRSAAQAQCFRQVEREMAERPRNYQSINQLIL